MDADELYYVPDENYHLGESVVSPVESNNAWNILQKDLAKNRHKSTKF